MLSELLSILASWVMQVIQQIGYAGVFFLMGLDSFNIPIPSEVTMPFAGFLASQGHFSFWMVVLTGTAGGYAGSVCSYYLAEWLIKNKNRIFLRLIVTDSFLQKSADWFNRYGYASVFFGRLIPVVRTFISLPAGLGKMPFRTFSYLTILGSLIWSAVLAYAGWVLGENWESIGGYFHTFDRAIVLLILIGAGWWIYRHVKKRNIQYPISNGK